MMTRFLGLWERLEHSSQHGKKQLSHLLCRVENPIQKIVSSLTGGKHRNIKKGVCLYQLKECVEEGLSGTGQEEQPRTLMENLTEGCISDLKVWAWKLGEASSFPRRKASACAVKRTRPKYSRCVGRLQSRLLKVDCPAKCLKILDSHLDVYR